MNCKLRTDKLLNFISLVETLEAHVRERKTSNRLNARGDKRERL